MCCEKCSTGLNKRFRTAAKWGILKKIGTYFWKKGDEDTIDRFGPNGMSNLVKYLSNKTIRFQTGYIYDYAFVMLIGLSALITYLILT